MRLFFWRSVFRKQFKNKEGTRKMKIKTVKKAAAAKAVVKKAAPCAVKKCVAKKPSVKDVPFTVHAEKGKAVYLAGQFNDWDPTAKKMAFKAGVYTATVKLAPGEYQYKFVIDGAWCTDPENMAYVQNDQGTYNSVITVK